MNIAVLSVLHFGTGNLGSECEVQCMNPKNKLPVAVSRAGSSPNVLSN